jgi:LacI family transcriptional regulator
LARAVPVVSIGDALNGGAAGEVLFDNRRGVREALEHLRGLGHREVAVLLPPRSPTSHRPSERIVAEESSRLRLTVRAISSPYELEGAAETATQVLQTDPRPTAVFCFSDSIAHGVYAAAEQLELAIPGDLSVIGYDDHPISALLGPPLTSFNWGVEHVAAMAVDMVLAAIDGRRRRRKRVDVEPVLRLRGSTAPQEL